MVAREGKRFRTAHLDVRAIASPRAHSRVGLVVPKYGRTAVERNRLKRRLREHVRLLWIGALAPTSQPRVDVVLRARPDAYRARAEVLGEEMTGLRGRLVRAMPELPTPSSVEPKPRDVS